MNLAVQRIRPISKNLIQVHRGHDGTGRKLQDFSAYIVETSGKRSKRTFFMTWKTLKKKEVTLTNSTVSKAER